jgi:hypothetical protein
MLPIRVPSGVSAPARGERFESPDLEPIGVDRREAPHHRYSLVTPTLFSAYLICWGDQTLYRIDRNIRYQHIGPLVRGTIKPRLFLNHWDDLLRTAGSLKLGWVTASLIHRQASYSRLGAKTR